MNWEVMRKSGLDLHQVLLASGASNETCVYDYESARTCIDINYYGIKRVVKPLLPLPREKICQP